MNEWMNGKWIQHKVRWNHIPLIAQRHFVQQMFNTLRIDSINVDNVLSLTTFESCMFWAVLCANYKMYIAGIAHEKCWMCWRRWRRQRQRRRWPTVTLIGVTLFRFVLFHYIFIMNMMAVPAQLCVSTAGRHIFSLRMHVFIILRSTFIMLLPWQPLTTPLFYQHSIIIRTMIVSFRHK